MKKKPTRKQQPKEEQMEDLIQRLRKVLYSENCTPIDIEKLEKDLSERDKEKISLLPKEQVITLGKISFLIIYLIHIDNKYLVTQHQQNYIVSNIE